MLPSACCPSSRLSLPLRLQQTGVWPRGHGVRRAARDLHRAQREVGLSLSPSVTVRCFYEPPGPTEGREGQTGRELRQWDVHSPQTGPACLGTLQMRKHTRRAPKHRVRRVPNWGDQLQPSRGEPVPPGTHLPLGVSPAQPLCWLSSREDKATRSSLLLSEGEAGIRSSSLQSPGLGPRRPSRCDSHSLTPKRQPERRAGLTVATWRPAPGTQATAFPGLQRSRR